MSRRNSPRNFPFNDPNRQSCPELRALESHLRSAYTLKALEAQIAEKKADRLAQQKLDSLNTKLLTIQTEKLIEEDAQRSQLSSEKREKYRSDLEDQMESKYLEKLLQEEKERREREVLIEVDRIVDEEYEKSRLRRRAELAEMLRRERRILSEMREIKRAKRAEAEVLMHVRIQEYQQEVERRSLEMKKQNEEQRKKREETIARVARAFVDIGREQREREALLIDLAAETLRQELLIEDLENERKQREAKSKMAVDLKEQMQIAVDSEERCRQRDRIFFDEVMAKIMEDEKVSILTAQARRRKQVVYKEDLMKLMEERKRIREAAMAERRQEWEEERMREEERRERFREERQRLIEEHAENVAKYLKHGVLTREEADNFMQK
uniref:Meiosis-specific nuclear structural protein 1 n=1 Tax=Bracon brevicornis TaxID=1563983 RepID=A0A6V7J712_9HYME